MPYFPLLVIFLDPIITSVHAHVHRQTPGTQKAKLRAKSWFSHSGKYFQVLLSSLLTAMGWYKQKKHHLVPAATNSEIVCSESTIAAIPPVN